MVTGGKSIIVPLTSWPQGRNRRKLRGGGGERRREDGKGGERGEEREGKRRKGDEERREEERARQRRGETLQMCVVEGYGTGFLFPCVQVHRLVIRFMIDGRSSVRGVRRQQCVLTRPPAVCVCWYPMSVCCCLLIQGIGCLFDIIPD